MPLIAKYCYKHKWNCPDMDVIFFTKFPLHLLTLKYFVLCCRNVWTYLGSAVPQVSLLLWKCATLVMELHLCSCKLASISCAYKLGSLRASVYYAGVVWLTLKLSSCRVVPLLWDYTHKTSKRLFPRLVVMINCSKQCTPSRNTPFASHISSVH